MRTLLALIFAGLLGGCATTGGSTDPRDPWEGFNRASFEMNDKLDQAILKPVAQGYQKVVPDFAQAGVGNFFENLYDIGNGINNILQGKPADGLSDLGRFAFNSVVGIFGLWDVATPLGLEKHNEDLGQTLAVWGVPSGPYFVIPVFGPSTVRDASARPIDPSFFYGYGIDNLAVNLGLYVTDVVRTRANLLQAEKVLDEAALDRYTFVRDAWLQRRRNQIFDGKPPKEADED